MYGRYLYFGDLGFDTEHTIEPIPCMESENIKKIYWIDGKNYPRVINIERKHDNNELGYLDFGVNDDPFSFYQKISVGQYNTMNITKSYVGGLFYAGVIQYAFSFYNKNAQETPIIYTTPLNYISHSDRGEEPNKQLGCAFEVTVNINPEDKDNFDYVRVYSIYRTSLDGTPQVKVVKDIKCDLLSPENEVNPSLSGYWYAKFADTNEGGYDFDAYRILVNSDHIRPNAIAHKDEKMFLGNYKVDTGLVSDDMFVDDDAVTWNIGSRKQVKISVTGREYYNYESQIGESSDTIKTFKRGESYKLGLQFKDRYGRWSSPYMVGTFVNDKHPAYHTDSNGNVFARLPYAQYGLTIHDIC